MVLTSRLSRPLQRRCTHCRRVQDVRLSALYHVVVPNKGGGTRRDGGYDCRFCGTANIVPAGEMPQGLTVHLPSRVERLAATAPTPVAVDNSPSETGSDETPVPAPAPPAPAPVRPSTVGKQAPASTWIIGTKARSSLIAAFGRARTANDGLCTAFVRTTDGALMLLDPRDRIDGDILDWLDRNACELLVLGGSEPDGSRWKMIFHPIAGAATLTAEPATGRHAVK